VENAAKYTPPGGHIRVSVGASGDQATVEVTDTGLGIAPEMLPHVFELFVQGERTLDRSKGGLGLGLTVVQRLVQLHGGRVEAHSKGPGTGATFRVHLPRIERPLSVDAPRAPASPARTRRLLIIEDNDDGRAALVTLLELQGYEVFEAADGPSGIERAEALTPDVAVVDIGLPGCDGFEVARRLRSRGQTLKLVALSGYGQDEDRRNAETAGFDAFIVKPIKLEELEQIIAELCESVAASELRQIAG